MEQACSKREVGGLLSHWWEFGICAGGVGRHAATMAAVPCRALQWGKGCPGAEVLALLAFVFSLQVSERGDDGEAKLKFLFEKLTTSKLKDSYL